MPLCNRTHQNRYHPSCKKMITNGSADDAITTVAIVTDADRFESFVVVDARSVRAARVGDIAT